MLHVGCLDKTLRNLGKVIMKSIPLIQVDPIDWRFWSASCLLGFTAGLFAGMSESPVGTALVAGIFGLIGGGGMYSLLSKGSRQQQPSEDKSDSYEAQAMLQPAALATSLFCIFSMIGVATGIALRQGLIFPESSHTYSKLIPIADEGKHLLRRQQLKLLILQSELASLGVSNEANNHFVKSFIDTSQDYRREGFNEDRSLGDLKLATKDLSKAVRSALNALSTTDEKFDSTKKKEQSMAIEDDQEFQLRPKTVEEIRYGDVMRANAYLKVAVPAAAKVQNYIEDSSVPELSAMLDLISRFREANVEQSAVGRASPLVSSRKLWGAEPERKASIKP